MNNELQYVKKSFLADLIGEEPQERKAVTFLYKGTPDQHPEVVRLIIRQVIGQWVEVELLEEPEPAAL